MPYSDPFDLCPGQAAAGNLKGHLLIGIRLPLWYLVNQSRGRWNSIVG
jgi:hypothetical protein